MKKIIPVFAILTCLMSSCLKENKDNDLTQDIFFQMMISGSWKVGVFTQNEIIRTSEFSDFDFKFLSSNDIRTSEDTNVYFGDWYVFKDAANNLPGTGFTMHISYSEPENLSDLSGDWNVLEATSSIVRLEIVTGGSSKDFLTFLPE